MARQTGLQMMAIRRGSSPGSRHHNQDLVAERAKPQMTDNASQRPRRNFVARVLIKAATLIAPWVVLVVLWYLFRMSGAVEPGLVPTPWAVATTFWNMLTQHTLYLDIYMSTKRVCIGVFLGTICAVPFGFSLGWYRSLGWFFNPLINFFRALPPIALIPLMIIYFGIGELSKDLILFYASFFASVIVMYEGISQITPIYIRVAQTLGATDMEVFLRVIVPMSLPHILTALRVALGVAWATLVAAELIAAQHGLGAVIENASNFFQLNIIYMAIICIGFIALVMDLVLRVVSRRVLSWQERTMG